MKKMAKDLVAGDRIDPPAHERKWLKNTLRVLEVREAFPDARGPWLWVEVEFYSPYNQQWSKSKFKFRPMTTMKIVEKPERTLWCVNGEEIYSIQVYEQAVESELRSSTVFPTQHEARESRKLVRS